MARCLHDYDPALLETVAAVLHALPYRRIRAITLYGALLRAHRYHPPPELSPLIEDLLAAYSAAGSAANATRARKDSTALVVPRDYIRTKLLGFVERALDDQRGAPARGGPAGGGDP